MSEAEAEAYLGDLLAHIDRREDAAARLGRALNLDPKLSFAHASLGMLLARRQRFDDARRHLREAVATGAQNYLAHYYYAFALSREDARAPAKGDRA
jgi:Flp pilus assembly protein TadD